MRLGPLVEEGGRFYDSHHHLLVTWSADAIENGLGVLLAICGWHGLDESKEFINRAA
jgi:hypothetical protein